MEFFRRAWEIQQMRNELFFDYWYVAAIVFGILIAVGIVLYRKVR